MKRITVLLAEDHAIVRQGFRRMLELEADLEVVGEAVDGRKAVAMVAQLRPAVVLMDIAMPLLNGLEATRQVLKAVPATKVLILSAHSDGAYVRSAIESGAAGFLLKQTSTQDVCGAIRQVAQGITLFGPGTEKALEPADRQRMIERAARPAASRLSSREMEVLQLIAEGEANKQIAAELAISIKTVEKHRGHLMQKLDIHDTASLTRYAIAEGIVECDVPLTII